MTHHREQVSAVLHRAVQTVLSRGLSDPRIKGMMTVTGVNVSPDFAQATVMVSIHPAEKEDVTMKGLIAAARYVRSEASKQVRIRRMPELHFKLDHSLKKQAQVLAALDEIKRTENIGEQAELNDETEGKNG